MEMAVITVFVVMAFCVVLVTINMAQASKNKVTKRQAEKSVAIDQLGFDMINSLTDSFSEEGITVNFGEAAQCGAGGIIDYGDGGDGSADGDAGGDGDGAGAELTLADFDFDDPFPEGKSYAMFSHVDTGNSTCQFWLINSSCAQVLYIKVEQQSGESGNYNKIAAWVSGAENPSAVASLEDISEKENVKVRFLE